MLKFSKPKQQNAASNVIGRILLWPTKYTGPLPKKPSNKGINKNSPAVTTHKYPIAPVFQSDDSPNAETPIRRKNRAKKTCLTLTRAQPPPEESLAIAIIKRTEITEVITLKTRGE
jgi:hypothetical protein